MKNKDYVSQKKRQKAPKQEAPKGRPFPVVKMLVVAGLIAAFVGGLLFIKDDSNDFQDQAPTVHKKAVKKSKPLPPPPEDEEWSFIEELENKNVEVESEELKDRGPYKMQCASFRSQSDAEGFKARIAFAGFESQVIPSQGTSGMWYKVILGPFERKRDAEKTRHILKRNDIRGCQIWLWR
ncbi:SPOR domain-containing protein [Psychrosphaera haliotis]|mgnify:FL=1|uniref:SPOR domain-containing protein n=1 Tax=Psychrosphaera haliotis TaxID=555083 RepID=UPI00236E3A72|nr:SPOR domain-containing protein [Psychrosphaera haliotis]